MTAPYAFTERQREAFVLAIVRDRSLSPDAVRVGVELAYFVNRYHANAHPGLQKLADLLNIDRANVRRAIKKLEGRHFIVDRDGKGGRSRRSLYRPIWPDPDAILDAKKTGADMPPFSGDDQDGENFQTGADSPQTGANTPPETGANTPPETQNINPEKNPEGSVRDFSGLSLSASPLELEPLSPSVTAPTAPFARQGALGADAGAIPPADAELLPFIARQMIRQAELVDCKRGLDRIDADQLAASFAKLPHTGTGSIQKRFRGYVRSAIDRAHQAERIERARLNDQFIAQHR